MRSMETIGQMPLSVRFGVGAAAAALLLSACTEVQPTQPEDRTTASAESSAPEVRPSTNPDQSAAILEFDYLGAGSTYVEVYPGPGNSAIEKVHNGSYDNGDTAIIECETKGRTVNSVPPEEKKSSDVWYRIDEGKHYATDVYAKVSKPKGMTIPECDKN